MSTLAGCAFFVGDLFPGEKLHSLAKLPGENLHLHSKVRGEKLQASRHHRVLAGHGRAHRKYYRIFSF